MPSVRVKENEYFDAVKRHMKRVSREESKRKRLF
jgi:ribosomal protein S21